MNGPLNHQDFNDLQVLLSRSLEGAVSRDEVDQLEEMLKTEPQARSFCRAYLSLYCDLDSILNTDQQTAQRVMDDDSVFNIQLWNELAEHERTAPAIEIPKEKPQRELIQKVEKPKVVYKVNKFSLYTAISLSAAAMLLVAFVLLFPATEPTVAVLDEQIGTEWGAIAQPLATGSELSSGALSLKKGFAKVKFNKGAEVIVEGPATFELVTDEQMILLAGKLAAMVPGRAKGFIVQTPTATIVDYGTEFGVEVDKAANVTQTHVFAGLVELRDSSDPVRFNISKKLKAGMAASVKNGRISETIKSAPEQFVKKMPSKYEMMIRRSNPTAYWRFADSLTNIIGDALFTGRVEGEVGRADVMTSSGQILSVLSIDPYESAGGHINYGDILDPGRDSFTVSMWIKSFSPEGLRRQFLISKRGLNRGWCIMSIGDDIMFRTGPEGGAQVWIGKKNCLTPDWHHVVMVIDRQTNKLKGYLDGSKDGWKTQTKADYPRVQDKVTTDSYKAGTSIEIDRFLRLGNKGPKNSADFSPTDGLLSTEDQRSLAFHGLIYDVAVWKRALNESEIRQLYGKGKRNWVRE